MTTGGDRKDYEALLRDAPPDRRELRIEYEQDFAQAVKEERVRRGWSIEEAARQGGTSYKTWQRIETGQPIQDTTFLKVDKAFSLTKGTAFHFWNLNRDLRIALAEGRAGPAFKVDTGKLTNNLRSVLAEASDETLESFAILFAAEAARRSEESLKARAAAAATEAEAAYRALHAAINKGDVPAGELKKLAQFEAETRGHAHALEDALRDNAETIRRAMELRIDREKMSKAALDFAKATKKELQKEGGDVEK